VFLQNAVRLFFKKIMPTGRSMASSPKSKRGPFRFRSVKFEISVIYTSVLAIILIVFSGVIYVILAWTLYASLDNEVKSKAREVSENIRTYLEFRGDQPGALIFAVEKTIASEDKILRRWWYFGFERDWFKKLDEQDLSKNYINFISPEGESLVHSQNISKPFLKDLLNNTKLNEGKEFLYYLDHRDQRVRVINYPFFNDVGEKYILQVGISPEVVVQLLQAWMNRVMLSIPILLILTSFIGRLLASRILRPVERITEIANTISHEDLNRRVEIRNFHAEMNSLGKSFNDMISRLEKSFHHIEQFSSYMAHEIKTPLTIMKGETELALLTKRNIPQYQKVLEINLEEIEKILRIVEDLLFLSRMDYQPGCFRFERLELSKYFHEIYEQASLLAGEKNIRVRYKSLEEHQKVFVKADPLHLRRLFFNVIDNAIKFTPPQGRILLEIRRDTQHVFISIADTGQGIKEEDVAKIFERFYRVSEKEAGSGLGLSIAQSIAQAHGGRIDVRSQWGQGTVFTVIVPAL